MTTISVQSIKKSIDETMEIDRQTAVKLNELVDNALFNVCHMNSFTEQPSSVNIDTVIKVINDYKEDRSLRLDASDVTSLISELRRNRNLLEDSISTRIDVALLMRILKKDTIKISDKLLRNLTIKEVVENHEEISKFFNKDVSITKLRAVAETYRKADVVTVGDMLDRKNLIAKSSRIESVISELTKRINSDVEVVIDYYDNLYYDLEEAREKATIAFAEYCMSLIESDSYINY